MKTIEQKLILQRLQKDDLHTPEAIQAEGICLSYLGRGANRVVYSIKNTPWVIKFGDNEQEIEAVTALRSVPGIRKYLPGLIWHSEDRERAIMVRYEVPMDDPEKGYDMSMHIYQALESFTTSDWNFRDIHGQNVGMDYKGRLKIIDCGAFYRTLTERHGTVDVPPEPTVYSDDIPF